MVEHDKKMVELITVYEVYTLTSRGPYAWKNRKVHANFYTKKQADAMANSSLSMQVGKFLAVILDGKVTPVFKSKSVPMTGSRFDACAQQAPLPLDGDQTESQE